MKTVLVLLFWPGLCLIDSSISLEASSNEIDILWQKYGELRGDLEILKAKRKYDLKRIKALEKIIAVKTGTRASSENSSDRPEENHNENFSVHGEEVNIIPGWTAFPFKLIKGSIHHTQSSHIFSIEVDVVDQSFSYLWYDDHLPILQDDMHFSIEEYKNDTLYRINLVTRHLRQYLDNNQIALWLLTKSHAQAFTFRYSNQNVTRLYQDGSIFKISPNSKSRDDKFITGNFAFRSNYIRDKKIEPTFHFIGLTGSSEQNYESIERHGYERHGPWKEDIFFQNTSAWNDEFQILNWTISEKLYRNGGNLKFSLRIKQVDDIFRGMSVEISDFQTLATLGYPLPKTFLSIIKRNLPIYLQANHKNVFYCGAMGQPTVPSVVIMKKENDDRLVSTGYQSFVAKTMNIAYVNSVTTNVTKGFDASFVCVARSDTQEELIPLNTTVVTPSKINRAKITSNGDIVVMKLTITRGDPPRPSMTCRENDLDGPLIWHRDGVYVSDETATVSTFEMTITANFSGIANPPRTFVCGIYGQYGRDIKTLRLN